MINSLIYRNLFHLVFVVPLFIYFGIHKNDTDESVFNLLSFIAIFVILYHSYRYYWTSWSINLIHIFIGGLLLLIGLFGQRLPNYVFYIFYVMATIVTVWHTYLIYTFSPSSAMLTQRL